MNDLTEPTNTPQEAQSAHIVEKQEGSSAEILALVKESAGIMFPQFTDFDPSEFENYDEAADVNKRGKVVSLYTEEGRAEESPRIQFIFRTDNTFVLNFYNSSEPNTPYTHRNITDSSYAPGERRWRADEAMLALGKIKIKTEGIDINDPKFLGQYVGWNEAEERFITMKEIIDQSANAKKLKKKLRIIDALTPEKAALLASERIRQSDTGELSVFATQSVDHINLKDDIGNNLISIELNKIDAQLCLLGDKFVIPRMKSAVVVTG